MKAQKIIKITGKTISAAIIFALVGFDLYNNKLDMAIIMLLSGIYIENLTNGKA